MSDPRMIPADDARVTIEASGHVSSDGYSWPDNYVLDLAHTVIEQAAQIERVREALSWIEGAQTRASEDWHRTLDPRAQHEMIAHQRDADWLRTAIGDTDD